MTRAVLTLMLVAIGLAATVVSPGGTSDADDGVLWSSGPLLTCPDVNGDGKITLVGDIMSVAGAFGKYGDPNYVYIYDVANGDGVVNIPDDIMYIVSRFGDECTDLTNQQVALATQAAMPYRDCSGPEAQALYVKITQMLPNMGIHLANYDNLLLYPDFYSGDPNDENDQLRHPVGLICTDSDPDPDIDTPDRLIGLWYLEPVVELCIAFLIPGDCEDPLVQPVGFGLTNTDEDNQWLNDIQKTWHTHPGFCLFAVGGEPVTAEIPEQVVCEEINGGRWYPVYGWMGHLYGFIPNQDGRFMMWSDYVPNEGE